MYGFWLLLFLIKADRIITKVKPNSSIEEADSRLIQHVI